MPGFDMSQWTETAKKVLEPLGKGLQESCQALKSAVEAQADKAAEAPQQDKQADAQLAPAEKQAEPADKA